MSNGYLAARFSRGEELCKYKLALEERGHSVPARWLLGNHQVEGLVADDADTFVVPLESAIGFALDDAEDIAASDFLIAFTEEPRKHGTRGGRHWELGFASGMRFQNWPFGGGRPKIYLVGPLEHVFTALPLSQDGISDQYALIDGRFEDWDSLIVALDSGAITL